MTKSTELIKELERRGWQKRRQTGSHVILKSGDKTVSVPFHPTNPELHQGVIKRILKVAGIVL